MAPDARLIPIKVSCGLVTADALTTGVDRAIAEKPDVVLLALGGYPTGPPDVSVFLKDRIGKNPDRPLRGGVRVDGAVYPLPEWTRLDNALVVAAMTLDNARNEVRFSNRAGDVSGAGSRRRDRGHRPDPATRSSTPPT